MSARDVIAKHLCTMAAQGWPGISTFERAAYLTTAIGMVDTLTSSGYRILGPGEVSRLTTQIAQLRHAYTHLNAERVTHQREFANGLIHPAIAALEEALCATHKEVQE